MKNTILLFFIFTFFGSAVVGQSLPSVFSVDAKVLAKNKARIQNNDALLMPAFRRLLEDANKALSFGPVSVMEKKNNPPSGNKHDYMSLAPYFWPDPSKPNGLPYLRKDGETNPEVKEYKDKEYMPRLCEESNTLALAYYFSGNEKYAEHAAKLIRVWFLDTATSMNSNLNFGQAIKGTNDGRGAGLIDSRHFIKLMDAIGLMKDSKAWTKTDQNSMQAWVSQFLHWMQTSKVGLDEMKAQNNHGVWYDAQRLSLALFVDSTDLAKRIVEHAKIRLDKQMTDQGQFPLEMERTTSYHYTTFAVQAFFTIAALAEKINIDFWNYTSPSGKSLQKAFDTLLPYYAGQKTWEGPQIKPFEIEETYPLLMAASQRLGCKTCQNTLDKLAGDKFKYLRIHLLYL